MTVVFSKSSTPALLVWNHRKHQITHGHWLFYLAEAKLPVANTWQTENYYNFFISGLSDVSSQLMVAEKKGTIRFYDLLTQQAILSLDCGQSPLMSADWCLTNTIKVGAVAGNDWLIWDITRSRRAEGIVGVVKVADAAAVAG